MEDRRKVVACLELCGKSDNDITKMLDGADKRGDLGMDAFVPQRIQDYIDKAKVCIQYRDRIQYCFYINQTTISECMGKTFQAAMTNT